MLRQSRSDEVWKELACEHILDYADRHGILLIPEIPMAIHRGADEESQGDCARQQMFREMIEEDENHPSIFAWSVCNESQATTQGGRA
jgi:beta-glucuronidase